MNNVEARQHRLIEEFKALPDWEARYRELIKRGQRMPALPEELHDEKFKVKGCQSQVWLHAGLGDAGRVQYQADSDALIVKGLAGLLMEVYSDQTTEDILSAKTDFLKDLGFEGHLSPSRANGLYAMLKQILYYATAFRAIAKLQQQR